MIIIVSCQSISRQELSSNREHKNMLNQFIEIYTDSNWVFVPQKEHDTLINKRFEKRTLDDIAYFTTEETKRFILKDEKSTLYFVWYDKRYDSKQKELNHDIFTIIDPPDKQYKYPIIEQRRISDKNLKTKP